MKRTDCMLRFEWVVDLIMRHSPHQRQANEMRLWSFMSQAANSSFETVWSSMLNNENAVHILPPVRICSNPLFLHTTEIDLPEGHDVVVDDGEVDLGESIEAAAQEELKWNDPGLDLLLLREGGAPPASN